MLQYEWKRERDSGLNISKGALTAKFSFHFQQKGFNVPNGISPPKS